MRSALLFSLLLVLIWPSCGMAQTQRRLEILTYGTPPKSITVQSDKMDSPVTLKQQGNLFYAPVLAGTAYRIQLRYVEDSSHHLDPGLDTLQIRYLVPPAQQAFHLDVPRDYPVSCNRPELNRLTASTDVQAWGNALRGRLMLLQRAEDSCDALAGEVKAAYLQLCRRVRGLDRNFLGLE